MRRAKYPIHPDFKKWENMNPPLNRLMLPIFQKSLNRLFSREKSTKKITVDRIQIPIDGATIRALLYSPMDIGENVPCLIYFHGGGFVLPAAHFHYKLAREYALRLRCKVLFVDYRLAPKYPFPAAPEDCYAAYCWLLSHAKSLSINAKHIAVGGDSAGGELATVVCLMSKDRGQKMPCGQLLIYPVTSRGIVTDSMKKYTDTPMCNSRDIMQYERLYMQDPEAGKREYSSPIHAASLEGLPPSYIETAEFDCLRDGGILYAERLRSSACQ